MVIKFSSVINQLLLCLVTTVGTLFRLQIKLHRVVCVQIPKVKAGLLTNFKNKNKMLVSQRGTSESCYVTYKDLYGIL